MSGGFPMSLLYDVLFEPFRTPFMARALVELVILGALAGTVGLLVLLRRLAFVTDTLTHTVFPGLVIGYLFTGEGGVFWGALGAGVATAILLTLLTSRRRVTEDAALAILLTTFFAVGVVLVSRRSSYTADLTAFLFGRVLTVSDTQILQTGVVTLVVVGALALLRRPLLLRTFDAEGARAVGYRVDVLDLVTNVLVALVVVAAARAIGTVLVIALLIVPAATARALTDRLGPLVPLAALVGVLGGWLGLAASYEASIHHGLRLASGGTVVLVLVGMYLLTIVVPVLARFLRRHAKPTSRLETP